MDRRHFLASATALAVAAPALARTGRPPNIVLIVCDDLGYGDIGAFGAKAIKTPALDAMARQGSVFTDFYAAANLCTPSRAGLLTGRYPVRTGLGYQVILQKDDRGLPLSEVTIPEALKPAGYVSGLFGKWHLGHRGPAWPPTVHGFDRFFGIPYSHDMSPLSLFDAGAGGVREEPAVLPQLQQRFYGEAERFIEQHARQPFFVELALSAPHLPEQPHAPFAGRSKAGAYGDVVEEIDAIVGRLLATLKRLDLDRDTMVLFTSDNGPWYEGSTGGLRQRKGGGGYDGGYRVPLIVRQPGTVPAGRRSSAIAMATDFLPTFCAMAGAPLPAGIDIDGADIGQLLAGRTALSPHDALILFDNEDPVAIRTQRWKYVASDYYRGRLFPTDEKYPQLYDMTVDPQEQYSMADRYPRVLAEMRERLADARRRFAPFKSAEIPPVFARGRGE
jgi:uncharacterized sulfatase